MFILPQELLREKARREAAEKEMRELLEMATSQAGNDGR